jgi:hypothetical protein
VITHGRTIEWTDGSYGVNGYESSKDAFEAALRGALRSGWKPPGWWQFWRWDESFWRWTRDEREAARLRVRTGGEHG